MLPSHRQQIALFPLKSVLFPGARTALKIIEPRYMDMVKTCLKAEQGFGVILLKAGSEVYRPGLWRTPDLAEVGCYARIVDWDALPQGQLGLVVEGAGKFRLREWSEAPDHLLRGSVDWVVEEGDQALPHLALELAELLRSLSAHPTVQQLKMDRRPHSALSTANQLAQLLPISPTQKQQLLELEDPLGRLALIEQFLGELAG